VFNRESKPVESSDLEEEITRVIRTMSDENPQTEEYTTMVSNLKLLVEARQLDEATDKPNRPSADTMLSVGGSVLGILLILGFEKANVITSKGLSFIPKIKI
jgi:hypothetical protein